MLEKEIAEMEINEIEQFDNEYHQEKMENIELRKRKVFEDIISLMNKKNIYLLGPEKTAVARFVANHFRDVYICLKQKIKETKS